MIEAAGGVVLRAGSTGTEVLVVHRVRYDDWSLPKGKLDDGESAELAAIREVEEETGVRAATQVELNAIHYFVAGRPKRVRWFAMQPVAGDPVDRAADAEVDAARWWPVPVAMEGLTYDHDREVLGEALTRVGAAPASTPPEPAEG
jgi:8-oxo-dGTP pyrophosphatase MutT (NUDIX family)